MDVSAEGAGSKWPGMGALQEWLCGPNSHPIPPGVGVRVWVGGWVQPDFCAFLAKIDAFYGRFFFGYLVLEGLR